jgi:hypothetical protein
VQSTQRTPFSISLGFTYSSSYGDDLYYVTGSLAQRS